jgi:hypothetical protein
VLLLLFLAVRSCADARKERAFEDYVRDVNALTQESNALSKQMFGLLDDPGDFGDVDVTNAFNQFRSGGATLVDRARDIDSPGEMGEAQRFLIETFEFRAEAISDIADALPSALAPQDRRESTEDIALSMQDFLASDRIYFRRFARSAAAALEAEGITTERVRGSSFLPSIDWLDPTTVADRISRISGAGAGDEPAAPGLHGNGLGVVTLGGVELPPGTEVSVTLGEDLTFEVQVQNQGENTETDVGVFVTVGEGGNAIELDETLPEIAAGETQTVQLPVGGQSPPTGEAVPITVEIDPVPGEEKTDNNSGEFSVIFTG